MKYKKIMFVLVLAIFIFGATSVSASDMNDTVIASENDSTIELSQAGTDEMLSSDEEELIGQTENVELISEGNSGTFSELQANITQATQGSTLTLNKNYEYDSGFNIEGIVINKSITIDGNGFKIDAHGNSRIFKITADKVVLKNIIFTNAKTENSGAVYFEKSGNVTNCSFTNNNNGEGAVFFAGKGEVTNCNFADNYATNGGAIYFSDLGTVTNCNFTRNSASNNGGVVYFKDTGVLSNCNFINSASKNNGGAVFFEKSGNVTNCNFTGSNASNNGGAVYFSSDGEVTNCNFADNKAAGDYSYGGAVYFSSTGNVTNCNFADNKATGAYSRGGAVYFSNTGEVTNCNFNNNTAEMGNAIYINNHCTISDCDFTSNPITKGAIHSATGDIALSNNIFNVDDAVKGRNFTEIQKLIDAANEGDEITIDGSYAGFGIPIRITKSLTLIGQNNAILDAKKLSKILYITASNVLIKNIQFTNGYAENGGAVFFEKSGNVENCNFTNNEVNGAKSSGGAIYLNGAGNVINSIFTANKATRNGGAIYVEAQSINNIFSCQFYNNYAVQSGGAILFHNLVQNNTFECIFKDNYAGYGAGIFFSKNANANRFNSDFINNTAKSCGGAMFFYGTTDNNNFTGRYINNSALGQIDPTNGNGGAITFKNVSTNSIFTCDFINNSASLNGGAVNYRETPENIIFNANFINNTAKTGGGVNFFVTFDVIFNGEFIGNSAEDGGALAAGYGNVKNVSFKDNHANKGGAVYFNQSGETVNCNFTNNRANNNGGAVYIHEKGNIVNCIFADNYAANNGGAVYGKYGAVENCNFTANAAKNDGGAVYLSYPSNVANCNFTDNSAKDGGALYFLNDHDNVTNCSFVANEAASRGGAVFFMTPQQDNVTNCYFEGNSAPEGGAIFCYNPTVTADSCIFKTDSDTTNNTKILSPTLEVYDFYSVCGSGEKLTFNLTTNSGMPITNGKISIIVSFKDNDTFVGNYACLSSEGWIVDLPVESYYACFITEYKEFEPIIKTIVIRMPDIQFNINVTSVTTTNKTVNITAKSNIPKNLLWEGKFQFILPDGTKINATYASNGTWWALHAFEHVGEYNVTASYVGLNNVDVKNATITINKSDSTITLDKTVVNYGDSLNVKTEGAIAITAKINGVDVSVLDNHVIPLAGLNVGTYNLTVTTIPDDDHNPVTKEVNITVNKVNSTLTVGDMVFDYGSSGSIIVSVTGADGVNANVVGQPKAVVKVNGTNITVSDLDAGTYTLTVTAIGDKNHNNITENATITVNKVNATLTVDDVVLDYGETKNITVTAEGATGIVARIGESESKVDGFVISIPALDAGTYTLTVTTIADKNHNNITENATITVNKVNATLTVDDVVLDYGETKNITVTAEGATGIVARIGESESKVDGFVISIPVLDAGTYTLTVTAIGDKNHNNVTKNATIIVNKLKTELTGSAITTTYNINKDLVITLKDITGKALSSVKVTVDLNGAKTYSTDKNGQVRVSIKALPPKKYSAKVTFNGNANYLKSTKTIKVTVKKATPKLTAKKKTFKKSVKIKKYTITLKYGKTALKKVKVYIKIKGKTYKATTNKKGKATFKIKKLTKKGTFKSKITFKGNKYYNKVTKKVKIKVK